jgi:hypothetical protein
MPFGWQPTKTSSHEKVQGTLFNDPCYSLIFWHQICFHHTLWKSTIPIWVPLHDQLWLHTVLLNMMKVYLMPKYETVARIIKNVPQTFLRKLVWLAASQIILPNLTFLWISWFTPNRTEHIRHQFRKTTGLSCHRCLINTAVEKMNSI